MRYPFTPTLGVLATLLFTGCQSKTVTGQDVAGESDQGIAVVELFTSQGCSSCPPADQVLREIASIAAQQKLKVYCLSFHVDYWNYLGWDDPYSQAAFTLRQRQYARAHNEKRVYTPQMIVNGRNHFVGSRKKQAFSQIGRALKSPITGKLQLNAQSAEDAVSIRFDVSGVNLENGLLNLAVVDLAQENSVDAGENSGRTLAHTHVVRAFKVIPLKTGRSGEVTLKLPPDKRSARQQLVGYLQHQRNLQMLAAGSVPLGVTP